MTDFNTISTEELLEIKKALTEVITYYQRHALMQGSKDEAGVLVPFRAQVGQAKVELSSYSAILNKYSTFTLDHVSAGQSVNKLQSIKEINNVSGNFPITSETLAESKSQTDIYVSAAKQDSFATPTGRLSSSTVDINRLLPNISRNTSLTSQVSLVPVAGDIATTTVLGQPFRYEKSLVGLINNTCIPCGARLVRISDLNLSLQLGTVFSPMLEQFKTLLANLDALLHNTEVTNDLCNILNFLDFQCVPDLAALIALLEMLYLKYTDTLNFNLGALASFLVGIFSPVLSGLMDLLDKYISLIVGPVNCIIDSLDDIVAKLDIQAGIQSGHIAQIPLLRSRQSELRAKIDLLSGEIMDLSIQRAKVQNTTDEVQLTKQIEIKRKSIQNCQEEYSQISNQLSRQETPTLGNNVQQKLTGVKSTIGGGLRSLRNDALAGTQFVENKLMFLKSEVEKMLGLSSDSRSAMIVNAMNLQRISRLISLVRALIAVRERKGRLCSTENTLPDHQRLFTDIFNHIYPNSDTNIDYSNQDGQNIVTITPNSPVSSSSTGDINLGIITKPNSQVKMPFDLCKGSVDGNTAEKIRNWAESLRNQ